MLQDLLPFDRNSHEGEDASTDGHDGYELADLAVDSPERPVVMHHVRKVEDNVESRDHCVRYR